MTPIYTLTPAAQQLKDMDAEYAKKALDKVTADNERLTLENKALIERLKGYGDLSGSVLDTVTCGIAQDLRGNDS